MARPAKIWLRKADGFWCVTHGGEKLKLSTDKAEAERAFHALKAGTPHDPGGSGPRPSLRHLVGLYLDEAKETKGAETYEIQRRYLIGFCEFVGDRKAPDVRVHHVKEWVSAAKERKTRGASVIRGRWGDSTRALAISTLIALFNWAVADQRLAASPIKGIKRGRFKRRERIIPADHQAKILAACRPALRDFLAVAALTGARPFSEVAKMTAAGIDMANGICAPAAHKNTVKGKARTIVFVPEALEVVKRLAAARPSGLLFLSPRGNPWARQTVNRMLKKAARDAGLPDYCPYDLRRSMVTQALASGLGANVVAQLVGNTPATINKYYDSLHLRMDVLKDAAARAVAGRNPPAA